MELLNVSHVTKRFGEKTILEDLSFSVKENSIYGFIGQNGAGKTTTMKMILGLYPIDSGEIFVNGEKVTYGQTDTNRYLGYLPDVPEFYNYMTPKEYLTLCGEISHIPEARRKTRIPELLELVGLANANKRIQGFSRGMKQRLGIASALLSEPKLLICDEPTSALDPIGRKEIIDLLLQIKKQTTVLFSTHILSDVERICDEIGLLNKGKLALHGTLEEIKSLRKSDGFDIEFLNEADLTLFLNQLPGGNQIEPAAPARVERTAPVRIGKTMLEFGIDSGVTMAAAMKLLTDLSLCPLKIEQKEPTLESLFIDVVKGK